MATVHQGDTLYTAQLFAFLTEKLLFLRVFIAKRRFWLFRNDFMVLCLWVFQVIIHARLAQSDVASLALTVCFFLAFTLWKVQMLFVVSVLASFSPSTVVRQDIQNVVNEEISLQRFHIAIWNLKTKEL